MSRVELLRRAGAGALLAAGGASVVAVTSARGADLPDVDLAYLRLLVAAELLKADVEAQALSRGKLDRPSSRFLRKMHADDKAHYAGLAALLNRAGQPPATAGDIDFSYPKGSFASPSGTLALASKIATLTVGAYLGALENVQTAGLRLPLGQIAANEAQHVSALAQLRNRSVIGPAFAPSLQIEAVSAALDRYES